MAATEPDALRPPMQNRSRETLERVLEAGERLLIEKGWDGFTVQEVSRRAKVSIGSIYARAPSKEALLLAIYDRATDRMAEENDASLAPDELTEFLSAQPDLPAKGWPRFVRIAPDLPSTATNKVLKRELALEGPTAGDGVLWTRAARGTSYTSQAGVGV
jgi:AcrR family transcriptional regulator